VSLSHLIEPFIEGGFSLLLTFGYPMLFVLFLLKGAIIGKLLPTSVFLPGYIFATSLSSLSIVAAVTVAAVGYVCGQLLIYAIARWRGLEAVQSIPWVTVSDSQLERADNLFGQYSGPGIFLTNLIPYLGSFLCIPAGATSYPAGRLTAYALSSTVLNYVGIVIVVVGSIEFFNVL